MSKNSVYYEMLSFKEQEQFNNNYDEQQILQDCSLQKYLTKRSRNFQAFLQGAFVFDLSNEGHDYWMSIVNSDRCIPNWVDVYFDKFDKVGDSIVVKSDCRRIALPMAFANVIADSLMINGMIVKYIIPKFEKIEIIYEKEN